MPATPDHAAIRRVEDAAAKKGVDLQVDTFDESTHTAVEAARAVGAVRGHKKKKHGVVIPQDGGGQETVGGLM